MGEMDVDRLPGPGPAAGQIEEGVAQEGGTIEVGAHDSGGDPKAPEASGRPDAPAIPDGLESTGSPKTGPGRPEFSDLCRHPS